MTSIKYIKLPKGSISKEDKAWLDFINSGTAQKTHELAQKSYNELMEIAVKVGAV